MPDQTQNNVPQTPAAVTVATEAAQILVHVIPGLGQYAMAIDLGFAIAQKVAPAAYAEVKALIDSLRNGNAPSADECARLGKLLADLQTPESYFQTKLDEAKAIVAKEKELRAAQLAAESKIVPPDKQPGWIE